MEAFERLRIIAAQFDEKNNEIKAKLQGKKPLQPATTSAALCFRVAELRFHVERDVFRLLKKMMDQLTAEITEARKQRVALEKTVQLAEACVNKKKLLLNLIKEKISKYTVEEKAQESKVAANKAGKQKQPEVAETEAVEYSASANSGPKHTPEKRGTPSKIATPNILDYLTEEDLDERLFPTSAKATSLGDRSCPRSASTGKRVLVQTPGEVHKAKVCLMFEDMPATPVMPVLSPLKKFELRSGPLKADFTNRVALMDIVEFQSKVDTYLQSLVNLEDINHSINKIDVFFRMRSGEPVLREDLLDLIKPKMGKRSQLVLGILQKMNRIKFFHDSNKKMVPIYGQTC